MSARTPVPADRAFAVIPCLNEREHVGRLIDDLLNDADWADPLIVVADGGSDDGTLEIVQARSDRDPQVRVLANPRRLQGAALNAAAIAHGSGRRWMIRVDAHGAYSPNYVSSLIEEARKAQAASVVVAMRSVGVGCFQRAVAAAQNSRLGTGGSAHRGAGNAGFVDHGHHALFDLERFVAVGGYDESFAQNEDAELDARLARAGGRIWLTRAASMVYYPRSDAAALFRQYCGYGRGRARTILKHGLKPRFRQVAPLAVPPALLLLVLSFWWAPAALPALVWAVGSLAYGVWLGAVSRSRCAAAAGFPAIIMHAGFGVGFWLQLVRHWAESWGSARPPVASTPTP